MFAAREVMRALLAGPDEAEPEGRAQAGSASGARYAALYNQSIAQIALGHFTSIQALKNWSAKRPELFNKQVYNLTGLDCSDAPSP